MANEEKYTYDEWVKRTNSLQGKTMSESDYRALEAAHVCAQIQNFAQLLQDTAHRVGATQTLFEQLNGRLDRLELYMARHWEYPLSQIYMEDVDRIRDKMSALANDNLRQKLETLFGDNVKQVLDNAAGVDDDTRKAIEETTKNVQALVEKLSETREQKQQDTKVERTALQIAAEKRAAELLRQ